MPRDSIIAGNWKMNLTVSESVELAKGIFEAVRSIRKVKVIIAPTFLATASVAETIRETNLDMGIQDVDWHDEGAFTGRISVRAAKSLGVAYVIIGHSEQRQLYDESDENVNKKARKILNEGLRPIVCIGETSEEREQAKVEETLLRQTERAFDGISPEDITHAIIAYEPVWAIGTGRNASDEEAEEAIRFIRETLSKLYSPKVASEISILYGGSMKSENALGILKQRNIDGGLIGGASLDLEAFSRIVQIAENLLEKS